MGHTCVAVLRSVLHGWGRAGDSSGESKEVGQGGLELFDEKLVK